MATVLVEDAFVESSNTPLASHVPAPTGTSWAEVEDTSGFSANIQVNASVNNIGITVSAASSRILYTASPTATSPDVDVEVPIVTASSGAARPWLLLARYQDTSNFYVAAIYVGTDNPDVKILKKVAGTVTSLVSANIGPTAGDIFKFELRGSTLKLYRNGSEVLSATDGVITAAGKGGVGFGNATDVAADEMRDDWRLGGFKLTEYDVTAPAGGVYYTAAAKAALQKGYTKAGADEPYLVLTLALPSGTRRYGSPGLSSAVRGGIEPRIASWGTLRKAIDVLTYSLSEMECSPELEDADESPTQRRLFAREIAKNPNQHRRSVATIDLVFPELTDADSYRVFTGILDGADQVAPMRWRLRLRTDDGPLRSTAGKTGAIPRVPLARYFDGIDSSVSAHYAPLIYGTHKSEGSGGKGFIPCLLVDPTNAKYLAPLGHSKTVVGVYEDGAVVPSAQYTVAYETVKGVLFGLIDFTAPRTGEITADIEGYTATSDGTGALLTDPGVIIKHLIVNFGYGDWRSGAWLADATAPIDATSFTTVGTFLTTMGYEASFYLEGGTQKGLLDVFNKWLTDHAAYAWWTNLGQLKVGVLDHRPPAIIYPADRILEGDVDELGGFATPFDATAIEKAINIGYLRGAAEGKTYQTLRVADSSVSEEASASLDLEWARASLL